MIDASESSNHGTRAPRRVLYVIGSLAVGGAERHVAAVASGLRQRGWDTSICALLPDGPLKPALSLAGVPVYGPKVPAWVTLLLGRRAAIWLRAGLMMMMLAAKLLRHRGTVIHTFLPAAYILGGVAACLTGAHPRIMSRRSLNLYQVKSPRYGKVERLLHPRMDVLVGNSIAVVRELEIEAQGRTPVRLIYNGIEPGTMSTRTRASVRQELGIDGSALVLVIVANLIPYKGHADLLEALGQISAGLPVGWRLLCIGRDDGIGAQLQEKARGLDIDTNILWLGLRLDVSDCLAAADIAILASHEEGFSNAVLEAMLAGLPMVVTDVGGNPEAVVDGVTGYVIPPGSPLELGGAILKLAGNPNRREMGAQGRERAVTTFSMEACLDAYEALYMESKEKLRYGIGRD